MFLFPDSAETSRDSVGCDASAPRPPSGAARPAAHGAGRPGRRRTRSVVVVPRPANLKHRRAQQAGQRVADPARIPGVRQPAPHPPHDPAAAQHFAARDRSRIPRIRSCDPPTC